jgi:DNA-binding response OmpR family regulator
MEEQGAMSASCHILIVDDERFSAEYTRRILQQRQYATLAVSTAAEACRVLSQSPADLLLLDLILPDAMGFDLCRWVRQRDEHTAVMFVSGRTEVEHRLRAFQVGADDFLCKPFVSAELIARVAALLRRRQWPSVHSPEGLVLDAQTGILTLPTNQQVALTPVEVQIISYLLTHPGQPQLFTTLARAIWGSPPDMIAALRVLDYQLRQLVMKIECDPSHPCFLHLRAGQSVMLEQPRPVMAMR